MKICWIADYTVDSYKSGGAQYTNAMYIKEGKKRGHKIDICTDEREVNGGYDFYILNNITHFTGNFLNDLIKHSLYMRIEHDYYTLENIKRFPDLFNNSFLNIFMSKMHMEEYRRSVKIPGADYVTSPINTKLFKPAGEKDNNMAVWVGAFARHKGIDNLIAFAISKLKWKFYLFGKPDFNFFIGPDKRLPENCIVMGEVSQEDLIKYYQRARYIVHLPNWLEPTGRCIMEGYLCGCDLIVNNRVGYMGEGWDWSDYEGIKSKCKTENILWDKIERSLKNA